MYWLLSFMLLLAAPVALAEPWLCTAPDGSKAFSYEPESATRPNCVHHPIPSSNTVRVRPRNESARGTWDFPRVDAKTQKQRDAARREILEHELAEEKKALAEAMKQLAEQQRASASRRADAAAEERLRAYRERVRLHMTNISNLEKELGREG